MKIPAKILITCLYIFYAANVSGHKYYFKQDHWLFSNLRLESVTLAFDNGQKVVLTNSNLYTYTCSSRITSITRSMIFTDLQSGSTINVAPYTLEWPDDKLQVSVGHAPVYPLACWDPGMIISANLQSIYTDEQVQLTIERNGYTGPIDINAGNNNTFTDRAVSMLHIPANTNSALFIPENYWSSFSDLFGGDMNVFLNNFYLRYEATFNYGISNQQSFSLNPVSSGPYRLKPVLETNLPPEGLNKICEVIQMTPRHVPPPYIIMAKQGSNSRVIDENFNTSTFLLDYATLYERTGFSNNIATEILFKSATNPSVETRMLVVVFLGQAPDTTGMNIRTLKQSCEEIQDGAITILLPEKTSAFKLRVNIEGQPNFISSDNFINIPLTHGTYHLNLEYQNADNLPLGCNVDIGDHNIPLTEKLTIESIQETKSQSCFYKSDVQLMVNSIGGVQEGPFTYYNIGLGTSTINTFSNLSGNTKYNFRVEDVKGCKSNIVSYTTLQTDTLKITINNQTNLKCNGDKGSIVVSGRGGHNLFEYSIDGGAYSSSNTFSNISGTVDHSIKMRDASLEAEACTTSVSIALPEPPKLEFLLPAYTLSNFEGYNIRCHNDHNGEIEVHGTGGTGNRWYLLSGTSTIIQEDSTFIALQAGVFNVHMIDENDCISDTISRIILTQPEGIVFNEPEVKSETCQDTRDGKIVVSFSGEASSFQWYNSENVQLPEKISKDLDSAAAGSYKLMAMYNADACSTLSSLFVIPEKSLISFSTSMHESCADRSGGGEIKLTGVNNGTAPYYFVFNSDSARQISSYPLVFENLDAGNYTIEVRDENFSKGGIYSEKCKASQTFVIDPKDNVSLTTLITEPLCNSESNGKITASVTGPDNPKIHVWFDSGNDSIGTGNILGNIPKGTYTPQTLDNYNCREILSAITVNEPAQIVFRDVITEKASCREISDGTISFDTQGGIGLHSYSLNEGISWQFVPVMTNLQAGDFRLLARDSHECIFDTTFTIEPFDPELQRVSLDSVRCNGSKDGGLSFKAFAGKTEDYIYYLNSISNSLSNTTGSFINLGKDDYIAYAKDSKGCYTDTIIQDLGEPPPLEVQLSLVDSSACGQTNGKISYQITGGNGDYQLLWTNSLIGETMELNINELKSGLYFLNVSDRKACAKSTSITIPDRPAPVITGIEILDSTWCNLPLGTVTVKVAGGSPVYRYLWDNRAKDTTATVDKLTQGIYSVTVTDRYNCSDQSSIQLTDGPELNMSANVENPHCGQKDGNVELSVSGGVSPFIYLWPDSISDIPLLTGIMRNLSSGSYPVIVSDHVGCSKTFTIDLDDLSGPEITHIDTSKAWCGLPLGSATVHAGGGSPPYLFRWTKTGSDILLGNNSFIDSLKAGNYTVRVTDSENCRIFKNIRISDSLELQPRLVLIAMDSAACNKQTGSLTVEMHDGLAPYSYLWNTGDSGSAISHISQGYYQVIAIDQRGCRDSLELQLIDRNKPVLSFVSSEKAYCNKPTGKVTLSASLGNAPYKAFLASNPATSVVVSFDPVINRYIGSIDSLMPSFTPYRIKIADANGCESNEIGAVIFNHDPMSVYLADMSPVSCFGLSDGQAIVIVENGYEPYCYIWDKSPVNSNKNSSLPPGPFSVTVTDAIGCTKSLFVTETPITQPPAITLDQEYIVHPSCFDLCDGSITPFAIGGNGHFLYIWNNEDSVQTKSNLCAGDHFLKIIDEKRCTYEKNYILVNPAPLTETDLPDSVKICSGQHFLADPGIEWNNTTWTANIDFESTDHVAKISKEGIYYLTGYSPKGCLVRDTLRLIVSDDLLDAQFLMMSQAYTGDTVVIIEVSWPIAENYSWEFPESVRIIDENPYYKEIVFDEPGDYYIQLTATLAGCSSMRGKYIEILDITSEPVIEPTHQSPLIKSFNIYPNPAVSDLNIGVELSAETDIRLEIISAGTGNLNRVLPGYSLNKYTLQIDIGGLQRGTYLIRLIAGDEVKSKLLVVR